MRIQLSDQTIDALAQIISGGSQSDPTPSIGLYRSGWQLTEFFRTFNVDVDLATQSRLPATKTCLQSILVMGDPQKIRRVIERAADPRDFVTDEERHGRVVDYLNRFLAYDNLVLETIGRLVKLVEVSAVISVVGAMGAAAEALDFDTVNRDLDRALKSAETDPEDAVTAACSVVESVCRSILIEGGLALPAKQDVSGLYRAVREPLGLSPTKEGLPDNIADDVRNVLSGLVTAVQSIGALRTHGGDAHGRERGFRRVDARIARLAIHSASAVAVFLLETWIARFPDKALMKR